MEKDGDGLGGTDGKQVWCRQVNVIYLRSAKGLGWAGCSLHPVSVQVLFCFLAPSHIPFSRASLRIYISVLGGSPTSLHNSAHRTFNLLYRIQMGIWAFKGNLDFLNLINWIHLQPRNCKGQQQWGVTHPIYSFTHQDKNKGPQEQGKLLPLNLAFMQAPPICLIF